MLRGFTVPKSPFGQAALTPPPPWHYSSDVVGVEFWADPKAAAATLPRGLSPDPKSNGHAIMMFLDWQFTAQDDEFLDPARCQYREAFVLLDAMYRDMPVMCALTSMSITMPRLRGDGHKAFQHFPNPQLCRGKRRGGASCARRPIWREPFRARRAVGGSLYHLAEAGRKWIVAANSADGSIAIFSATCCRIPRQTCSRRVGDVNYRRSYRRQRMGGGGRAPPSGRER